MKYSESTIQPIVNIDRDLGIKLEIPESDEKLKLDKFMHWLVCRKYFCNKPMTEGHKVTLVATRFRNYVVIWWAKLQKKRSNQNIDPIQTWIEVKTLLRQKFLPVNYSRDLCSIFQGFSQGSKMVVEYSKEFMTMQAHCGLNEVDDVLVSQYFHGLRVDIQYILALKNLDNVDEVIQHAIKVEDIANYQA